MRRIFLTSAAAIRRHAAMLSSRRRTGAVPLGSRFQLASFSFTPRAIRLRARQPVNSPPRQHIVGRSDFTARVFFAAARCGEDRSAIAGGSVEVRSRKSRDIALVPLGGQLSTECSHTRTRPSG